MDGLLKKEWHRLVFGAKEEGIPESDCRRLLGLLATAREPLTWSNLLTLLVAVNRCDPGAPVSIPNISDAIQVLQPVRLIANGERILIHSRAFFRSPCFESVQDRFTFFHTSFGGFVRDMLAVAAETEFCETLLAQGCAEWRSSPLREYAIRNRFQHLLGLPDWCVPLGRAFAEEEFVRTCFAELGVPTVHRVALEAVKQSGATPSLVANEWNSEFKEWERFLRWRTQRFADAPHSYAQEVVNEFIRPQAPSPRRRFQKLRDLLGTIELEALQRSLLFVKKTHGAPTMTGRGHSLPVATLAFSSDGSRMASGGADRTVKVWDTVSGELIAECVGHVEGINCVAFSPDNKRVASGSGDGTVRIWEVETGALVARCEPSIEGRNVQLWGEQGAIFSMRFPPVRTVAFSGDSKRLVSGGDEHAVRVWDADNGREVARGFGHSGPVISVAFYPDHKRIVSASVDTTLRLWNALNGSLIASSSPIAEPATEVGFSSDGRRIISRTAKGAISFWKMEKSALIEERAGNPLRLKGVCFAGDAVRSVRERDGGIVKIKNVQVGVLENPLLRDSRNRERVAFSSDGKYIAKADADGTVRVAESKAGSELAKIEPQSEGVISLAVAARGKNLATTIRKGNLKVWDGRTGTLVTEHNTYSEEPEFLAFSFDGTRICRGDKYGHLEIWDFQKGESVRDNLLRDDRHQICCVAFSPKGEFIITGHSDGKLQVWDAATAKVLCKAFAEETEVLGCITSVAFSPTGEHVAGIDRDGMLNVWKFGTFVFSTDENHSAVGGHSMTKVATLKPGMDDQSSTNVYHLGGRIWAAWKPYEASFVNSLSFSPDGARLVIGGHDKTVKVWDWRTNALTVLFFDQPLSAVSFVEGEPAEFVIAAGTGETWAYRIAELHSQ